MKIQEVQLIPGWVKKKKKNAHPDATEWWWIIPRIKRQSRREKYGLSKQELLNSIKSEGWNNIFDTIRENKDQPRNLFQVKIFFK